VWPGARAVGRTLVHPDSKELAPLTVVAVVRDVPIRSLGTFEPVVYLPSRNLSLMLVPNTDPATLEQLRAVSQAIEPAAVLTPTPMREIVRESFSETAAASLIGWMVGAAALLISTLGIFGVFSYAVEERRREIGIRIALGGAARHVSLQVLRSGQRATVVGVAIGFVLCAVAASLLRSQLFGLQPFDAVTYLQVATILATATMLALWIPARRATRVDPAITLRCE
jgi:ABC-type lipoprotein release transport system permease subunit